jgi:hypothetical protein
MQTTRRKLLDDFLAFVGETGDATAYDLAVSVANRALEKIYLYRTWRQFVLPRTYSFSTIAGTASYALPPYFGRVSGADGKIRNLTTGTEILPADLERLQQLRPEIGTSLEGAGVPDCYALGGVTGVAVQPPVGDQAVSVVSSDALDVQVRVEVTGLDAAGNWQRIQVALNGLVAQLVGTFSFIETFTKAYPYGVMPATPGTSSAGTVTLRTQVGGVTLGTLLADESAREYALLTLSPKPSGVWMIGVPIYMKPTALTKDTDVLADHWELAVLEEMLIQWRINTGEMTVDTASNAPRPALLDLVAWENLSRVPSRTRPFMG